MNTADYGVSNKLVWMSVGTPVDNASDEVIYFRVTSFEIEVEGRKAETVVSGTINMVPPRRARMFAFGSVKDIELKNPALGSMSLEMLYGTDKEIMQFRLTYRAEIQLSPGYNQKGELSGFRSIFVTKKNDHERL